MSIPIGLVTSALRRLVTECNNAAVAAQVPLPDRQYVTTGGAVYDCEQVTASANSITSGIAGDQSGFTPHPGQCVPGWQCVIELSIVRKASEAMQGRRGTVAPSVKQIESDTDLADKDAAILTAAVEAIAGPDWDQYGIVPAQLAFGDVEGGFTAVVLTVTLNLWDFPPEEPGEPF